MQSPPFIMDLRNNAKKGPDLVCPYLPLWWVNVSAIKNDLENP